MIGHRICRFLSILIQPFLVSHLLAFEAKLNEHCGRHLVMDLFALGSHKPPSNRGWVPSRMSLSSTSACLKHCLQAFMDHHLIWLLDGHVIFIFENLMAGRISWGV